jgi:hypothetical protein
MSDSLGVLYPIGYATSMVTMSQLKARHMNHMHPAFAERLFPWIESQGGAIGIGGGYRDVQPVKPGFAPPGKSFHQGQTFASGLIAYCAVDLVHVNPGKVHRAPTWAEVPAQGSAWAAAVKVHCNVSAESWHMQPIEIDGYDSWVAAGRPDPKMAPKPVPIRDTEGETMYLFRGPSGQMYATNRDYRDRPIGFAVSEDDGAMLRDQYGYDVAADTGPHPIDANEERVIRAIAGLGI